MTRAAPVIVVLDMRDRRPAWAMPDWVPERLAEVLAEAGGPGELRVVDVPADGSGDGAARAHPEVLEAVEDADAYLGYGIPAEVLRRGRRLRWVHSGAAGVGGSLGPAMREADVVFTNSAGIHAPPMAEAAVGMILHFLRGFDFAVRSQREGRWDRGPFDAADTPVRELAGATVGVFGFGGVGRAVGWRCAALGARVVGARRTGPAEEVVELGTPAGPVPVTVRAGGDALERLADDADVLVVTAPETAETRGAVDARILGLLGPGGVLVNLARGGLVDEEALVGALRGGGIRGAALDVVASEPLPPGHPLWSLDNVLLTPHVSAATDAFWGRETELVVENLRRLRDGRPLRNVVDPGAGY